MRKCPGTYGYKKQRNGKGNVNETMKLLEKNTRKNKDENVV
jgi:hypothetical protein